MLDNEYHSPQMMSSAIPHAKQENMSYRQTQVLVLDLDPDPDQITKENILSFLATLPKASFTIIRLESTLDKLKS